MVDEPNITIEQMAAELGGSAPAPQADPTPTPTPEPTPAEDVNKLPASSVSVTPQEPASEPDTQIPGQTPPNVTAPLDKAQSAFAQMRITNKRQSETLKAVAAVLGIDTGAHTSEDSLLTALQSAVIKKQAETENIPEPVLSELVQLRQNNAMQQVQQRNAETAVGFQKVMDTYKLTQVQLNDFANELITAGKNPLEQSVDLLKEYRDLHFDEIIAKAKQDAIIAEQNRAAKATQQSTTPGSKQGAGSAGEPAKVNSVRELNNWFDERTRK